MQTAWEDIERFKEQKNKDLREALISYAIMQMSMCKKVFSDLCVFPFTQLVFVLVYLPTLKRVYETDSSSAPLVALCLSESLLFPLTPSLSQGIQVWSNAKECFNKM